VFLCQRVRLEVLTARENSRACLRLVCLSPSRSGIYLGAVGAALYSLHLQPGKLQFFGSCTGFTLKYIRAWMLFAWPHVHGRFRLLFMVAA
jgi:hypothetical protein